MQFIVGIQSISFIGQVKDIVNIFNDYPPETTLKEFIKLNLH